VSSVACRKLNIVFQSICAALHERLGQRGENAGRRCLCTSLLWFPKHEFVSLARYCVVPPCTLTQHLAGNDEHSSQNSKLMIKATLLDTRSVWHSVSCKESKQYQLSDLLGFLDPAGRGSALLSARSSLPLLRTNHRAPRQVQSVIRWLQRLLYIKSYTIIEEWVGVAFEHQLHTTTFANPNG
jgi:hypothetical protein